jgi:hypothetical protein
VRIFTLLAAGLLFLLIKTSYAQTDTNANDAVINEKLNFIQNEMNNEKTYATTWTCGWTVINGGSAAYFYYKASKTHNKASKVNDMVIGVGSNIAFVGNVVTPMVSMYAPHFLDAMPDESTEDKKAKLLKAEDYLSYGSTLEVFGTSWISQSINVATASAGAFVVGYVYRDTMRKYGKNPNREALVTFIECFMSGELQMLTQPMGLVSAEKKYHEKYGAYEEEKTHAVMFYAYPQIGVSHGWLAGAVISF